jgi:hypothetical protein
MVSGRAIPRESSVPTAQEPFRGARVSCWEAGAFAPHDREDAADL